MLARGSSIENGATNFYALHQDPETMTENVSQAFLGLSIGCAKCHNHPLEKWTNDQYYAMANLFARVQAKGWGGEPRNGDGVRTLFVAEPRRFGSAIEGRAAAAGAAGWRAAGRRIARTTAASIWPSGSRRRRIRTSRGRSPTACGQIFSASGWWSRSTIMRLSNPASNEELLAAAAKYLVEHKYDLKALMRAILQSAAYQRSSDSGRTPAADDTRNYAQYYPRRLMAEVALDAISQVTGVPTEFTRSNIPAPISRRPSFTPRERARCSSTTRPSCRGF